MQDTRRESAQLALTPMSCTMHNIGGNTRTLSYLVLLTANSRNVDWVEENKLHVIIPCLCTYMCTEDYTNKEYQVSLKRNIAVIFAYRIPLE